jgi:hypothetical protein
MLPSAVYAYVNSDAQTVTDKEIQHEPARPLDDAQWASQMHTSTVYHLSVDVYLQA